MATTRDLIWRRDNDIFAHRQIGQRSTDLNCHFAFVWSLKENDQQIDIAARICIPTGMGAEEDDAHRLEILYDTISHGPQ
jgi:hypothetical protein